MTTTPLSVVTNTLGGRLINIETRKRIGMSTILKSDSKTIAVIKDEDFTALLGSAALLRQELSIAVFILENLPHLSIDTAGMKRALEESGSSIFRTKGE